MADYRLMRADDMLPVIRLWSESFSLPHALVAAKLAGDGAALRHTLVATAPDGALLATVHYQLTRRYDAEGQARLVGEIDSVVTRAEDRRQGHATGLLTLAITMMQHEGCDWALLLPSDMSRSFYTRQGWRPYPERWRIGALSAPAPLSADRYQAWVFDPIQEASGWERIAAVDLAFHDRRPLSVLRDASYWRSYAAVRVRHWMDTEGMLLLAVTTPQAGGALCGYATVEFNPGQFFQIRDVAILPHTSDALVALIQAAAYEAQRRHVPAIGRIFLPQEPALDTLLEQLFGATLRDGLTEGPMARTIDSRFSDAQLDAVMAHPKALYSCIDHF